MSLERGEPARFLCALPDTEPKPGDEEFTLRLTPPPLALTNFESALCAVLGRLEFSADLLQKLHGITGGDPGLIGALVDGLIRRRLIHRVHGVWRFRGEQDVQSIALPELRNRWGAAWEHLDDSDRDLLTLLALCPRSLLDRTGARILRDMPGSQRLAAMGWLQPTAGGWGFSSESARAVVDELAPVERRRRLALAVLSNSGVAPTREERADLLLEAGRFPEAVAESAWAAEAARTRGDFRAALRRLDRALSLALRESDVHRAREVALLLADVAHASGLLDRADAALSDPAIWGDADDSMVDRTRRSLLLGLVAKSRGQFPEARRYLGDAIDSCPGGEPRREYLRAVVELSEIDWRHSDEAARLEAIDQLSSSLRLVPDTAEYADLRGAILYGLGAARFLAGRFPEAKEVLAGGLAEPVPDFFRIRMSNALAMTVGRLGDFSGALLYLDDAWDIAERSGLDDFRPRLLSSRGAVLSRMGRAREAGEQDLLSARWARRLGNRFEYIAGCSGAATNLVASAAYEEAIRLSREARDAANAVGSRIYVLKECETEALALYCMGLHDEAERLVREGLAPLSAESDVQVKPRLLWLLGKILLDRADTAGAEAALGEAKQLLATAPDSEDLLGVEIELHRLRATQDPELHAREIGRVLSAEVDRENWSVVLPGAVILAEIGRGDAVADGDHIDLFTKALARAEEYGWREVAWRLSGALGLRYLRGGDRKLAQTRLAHATRVLREVASDLSAEHQRAYLSLPHVRTLLEAGSA
jgi:tetratricopeptide (TPR) repeat protein